MTTARIFFVIRTVDMASPFQRRAAVVSGAVVSGAVVSRAVAAAAASITSATARAADANGVWSTGSEVTAAPIRVAMNLCVSGDTIRSRSATKYQDGFSFHAGVVIFSAMQLTETGFCVAAMSAVSSAVASGAAAARKPTTSNETNPSLSG